MPKLSIRFFCILHMMNMLFFSFNVFFIACLIQTKDLPEGQVIDLIQPKGLITHPVTDARYLWDNRLTGITYEKDNGVGLQRILLKWQHYWVISPLSLLEHKNETVKGMCKELGRMGSYHMVIMADTWIKKEAKIPDHYLCHGLCSFNVKNSDLLPKFYLKLEAT